MAHHRNAAARVATRVLPALATLLLAGCAGTLFGALNAGAPRHGIAPGPSVEFAPDRGLALDVYRPQRSDGGAPIVVFYFGGSWQDGNRARYAFAGRALAARGMVAVLPDYRLYPAVRFPAFMEDAADAVAWTHANARRLGADPARLYVMGHSAGAQIAALLATDERWLARAGLPAGVLAGAIAVSGPHDLRPEGYPDLEDLFGPRAQWPQARPVEFVDGREPPFLLVHGTDDDTVWPTHSEELARRLRAVGVPVRLRLYDGMGHVRPLLALRWPRLAPVLDDTAGFVGTRRAARGDGAPE
jgi:acetyl esterase/lipase